MAVYTEVSDEELEQFIAQYDIGHVVSCKGIAEGVENSNFMLRTERSTYILTLYEKRVNPGDLPFFVGLMEHLASHGLACPTPLHGRDGQALRSLCGRPAAIVTFLEGLSPKRISSGQCAALGTALAQLHQEGLNFTLRRKNSLGPAAWRPLFDKSRAQADTVMPGLSQMLLAELDLLETQWPRDLPTGIVHADLFPDNVFFMDNQVSGLIDFYFACTDYLAYDIAICLNAWCFEPDASFNITKAHNLLTHYQRVRPLTAVEHDSLPILARGAAMRFLLTRLFDWLNTPPGALVQRKDPLEYVKKLRFHAEAPGPASYGLHYNSDTGRG